MITVRALKIYCEDEEFYKFFRKEQREQNKALNLAIGYIHTHNILKSNDSGKEEKSNKSIEKLENKIKKLEKDLENPKTTDKKKKQILKAINTNKELIEGEKEILEESKQFRQGLDKKFNEIYIDNNNLYHLLKSQTQIQYKRNIDMVTKKVKSDYDNNFTDIVTGKCSLMNYKQEFPLMIDHDCIKLYKEDDKYFIRIMLGFELEIVLGKRENENVEELKATLDKCIEGIYSIRQSQIKKKKKDIMFLLTIDIPKNTSKYEPVKNRVLGVDLGIKYPAYVCLSDDIYKRRSLGSIDDFLRVRKQMQERRKKLQRDLSNVRGGKGRNKKTQALNRLKEKEKDFVMTYNHMISKSVVEFAKKNKCEYIHLEKLTKDGFNDKLLRNWSYYQLGQFIEYKAKREGIEVRRIDPAYTSQTCSRCGCVDENNRQTQEVFVCTKCGFGKTSGMVRKDKDGKNIYYMNADHNAAINIARSDKFIKENEEDEIEEIKQDKTIGAN